MQTVLPSGRGTNLPQGIMQTASAILNGTYKYPDDFGKATRELCVECALIR